MGYDNASTQRKQMISKQLKELLKEKNLSKISVSEIIRNCKINRKTFYYHFEDIYDLLKWTMEQETLHVIKQYDLLVDYDTVINDAIDYVEHNRPMLYNIYNSFGRNQLQDFFYACYREIVEHIIERTIAIKDYHVTDEYKRFLIDFYTEGLAGMISSEVSTPMRYSKEMLSKYIFTTFHSGILSSLHDADQNHIYNEHIK